MKSTEGFQPISQESTPALIAAQLRSLISKGSMAPGAQLVEMDIASALGVSRGPIREAIQRLTQEGLLVSIRNRGVFVAEFEAARAKSNPEAMSEADVAFHERLVAMAASPRLSRMHGTLLTETRMCLNRLEGRYLDESVRVAEHRHIAEALKDGKSVLLMKLLDAHKDDALARLLTEKPSAANVQTA
jgi:DNA-binding GntR family transcriptional regulator